MSADTIDENCLQKFITFLKIPSISADPDYKEAIHNCADWVAEELRHMGFSVDIWQTSGAPVVFASWDKAGKDRPTLLLYCHYDVQPVDPLELWDSPPFEPVIKNGNIYARGAQDNKGQCFYTLEAVRQLLKETGKLPINIKFCIEGEEECGSAGLLGELKKRPEQLQADYLAIVDLGMKDANTPAVTLGCRGIVAFELIAEGPKMDLHSGSHGGLVKNPIQALVQVLSELHDEQGKVAIPGFYDQVKSFSQEELAAIALDFNEQQYEHDFGATPSGGELGYKPLERVWLRPTLELNGITGGYTGIGFKTVIPAKASAKFSCRLAANQDPEHIVKLVTTHLQALKIPGITFTVERLEGGGSAVNASPGSPIVQAFKKAYSEVFGVEAACVLEGGSIPVTAALKQASGAELVMVGLGLATDQIHSPNEHFALSRLEKGIKSMKRAFELIREIPS